MATLEELKQALKQAVQPTTSGLGRQLSNSQYCTGFDILRQGSTTIYNQTIVPQLTTILQPVVDAGIRISVLEIGPGPESVLGLVPFQLRRKITRYVAYEPNRLFASRLAEWLRQDSVSSPPLPCLDSPPTIYQFLFDPNDDTGEVSAATTDGLERFDVVLFCHSMYGMRPRCRFVERALSLLRHKAPDAIVIVFHRAESLDVRGLVAGRITIDPTTSVCIDNTDETLDHFASFIAGFDPDTTPDHAAAKTRWREICRNLGRQEGVPSNTLTFNSPIVMAVFTPFATVLPHLSKFLPVIPGGRVVKNREARTFHPASSVRPTEVAHIQHCVRWALSNCCNLTVIGGGHSGHCVWPNVVSVDMSAFNQIDILPVPTDHCPEMQCSALVMAQSGCTSDDIVRQTTAANLAVPLGSRPSVGCGLWLQGGFGHSARSHGLACDALVGAVMISVRDGQILCVGHVPSQCRPNGAIDAPDGEDLLWALRGAGTNFGIVLSVIMKAYPSRAFSVRSWVRKLNHESDVPPALGQLDEIARKLPRHHSLDVYIFYESELPFLGVSIFEGRTTDGATFAHSHSSTMLDQDDWGPEVSSEVVDGIGLLDTDMYMTMMHGGHSSGKTSSFKRCLFLKSFGATGLATALATALQTRPSPRCYYHLVHGGGAVSDILETDTAFGNRKWEFACVITGVWPREGDGTVLARGVVAWVYDVALALLPFSSGVYGADLGPDPRDAPLAATAFGPNLPRLVQLKSRFDPSDVLAYACPLPRKSAKLKLVFLVTGEHGVGKDYCADVWVSVLTTLNGGGLKVRASSISDSIKREYATATGSDAERLLWDRKYKEQHRRALTSFFSHRLQRRPDYANEHFLSVVNDARDTDVLFITGMQDEAPVAQFSHLVPNVRLVEIRVEASEHVRAARRSYGNDGHGGSDSKRWHSCLVFKNDTGGNHDALEFFNRRLFPLLHPDLQRLAGMVRAVPGFPRPGIDFRDVLGIVQQPGGLALCTSLLQTQFTGDWDRIAAVVCCEAAGFVYGSALALAVEVPLMLIRNGGKLPPPVSSADKASSHISSLSPNKLDNGTFEIQGGLITEGASVVVVDDVLATGQTLCAILHLLSHVGVRATDVHVLVVAEFPAHRGRASLRRDGICDVKIQSLLVLEGA